MKCRGSSETRFDRRILSESLIFGGKRLFKVPLGNIGGCITETALPTGIANALPVGIANVLPAGIANVNYRSGTVMTHACC